ncbi:PH domain-containing protein [Streptomyces sp. GS7]|uniref:PH domain-containing protein n=1 Tax=Streptomyces sp. GS7 TaxID=2692234 RepID=UPI001316BD9D|nr:PH domain-containing protein [Streptomyces sp. GS7]QHC25761.1 PH domain-containing protein [Streptomyces sp. GS7]
MTSPDRSTPSQQQYAERSYRSPAALAGGALLLLLGLWLGADAVLRGTVHTKLTAVFVLLLGVPLVVAFTLRPLVRAGEDRLTVRNPFRTITLPWSAVEELRATFSAEVFTGGGKYQLWAIPVSLRQRKKAARQPARGAGPARPRFGLQADAGPAPRAMADQALEELREIRERAAHRESAQGEPEVRWAYAVIAPSVAGAVGLAVMLAL